MIDSRMAAARARLLEWYDRCRRDLPWRTADDAPPDPYRVWLSEAMLQQTRVETVRPYYERWIERFPTLDALARASLDDVLKSWEGLGYYSRARNLHRAAREVAARYGGAVPDDPATFRSLPGVGRYTAGAVMSIAFGLEEPVVDGNVRRVFARLLDSAEPTEAELWGLAAALVRGERPGSLNQAVMELGATVCTPRSPRCDACPIAQFCAARAAGSERERPARRRRNPLPLEQRAAAVVLERGRLLMAQRREGERLAGLWEFPGGIMLEGESARSAVERLLPEALGLQVRGGEAVAVVDHTFTHVRVSYHAVRARIVGGEPAPGRYAAVRWVTPEEMTELALPRAQQRIAALAANPEEALPAAAQG
jgi:A/G-specific adenine glycosylase